jgi:serine protease DegQ
MGLNYCQESSMLRKLWLIFAQAAALTLGVLVVIALFKPDWLIWQRPPGGNIVTVKEAAPAPAPSKAGPASFSVAARKAMPAVVNIFTSKQIQVHQPFMDDPFFQQFFGGQFRNQTQRVSSLGSGVIVSPEGYILTNAHVVEAADEIEVALADGRTATGRIIGSDPDTDLAVIKVKLTNLPTITFGNAADVQVGDVTLAIGNPFGVGQTVTMGIVSALGRSHLGINTFENFIQTDAAINPGNSGGALVDANGNLIGINSAIYSKSGGSLGIGFAIPVNLAKQIMEQIIKTGSVVRGWIGVEVQDITPELATSFNLPVAKGVIITGILRGGPADLAGIRPGDVLVAVNGTQVTDSSTMLGLVANLPPGSIANLKIIRDGKESIAKAKITKRPARRQAEADQQ